MLISAILKDNILALLLMPATLFVMLVRKQEMFLKLILKELFLKDWDQLNNYFL